MVCTFGVLWNIVEVARKKVVGMDTLVILLRSFMSNRFLTTRKRMHLSQAGMAERLLIDPRSYIDLEHGKSLCSTRVLILYLLQCDDNPANLLSDLRLEMEHTNHETQF